MNERKGVRMLLAIIAALMLVVGGFSVLLAPEEGAYAAPPAAPTPVAELVERQDASYFVFVPATAITADAGTSARDVRGFNTLDVQYVIDHGTVNTTTLTVQYSIDNSHWTDGANLVAANAADADAVVARVPVFGRYMRIYRNVTNANPITITLVAVGR